MNVVTLEKSVRRRAPAGSMEPVFILAPPCTFSWALCAMLGEHPELYAPPELHLFISATLGEWLELCSNSGFEMDHGLVRTVAELYFGGQTEMSVSRARGWLQRRAHFTTGLLLEVLIERVSPLVIVEKSPSIVHRVDTMQRAWQMFPTARFVHLVSHPRLYGRTVAQGLRAAERSQPLPPSHWLAQLASPRAAGASGEWSTVSVDPQFSWLAANRTIAEFLDSVPPERQTLVRGEELLADDDHGLAAIAAWLTVRDDDAALADMRHPERSPYARRGPPSAEFGSDAFLLDGPLVGLEWTRHRSLDGPLGWRGDGRGFAPEIRELAQRFGYT
jgi:hypothetical protein